MPLALSQAVLSRHGGRAPAACCAIAVILVTAWSGISTVALAQSDPLRQPNGQGRMSAPIGHRQPRAQDLPPDVLREEGMTRQLPEPATTTLPDAQRDQANGRAGQRTFGDNQPQICRGC